MNKRALLKKNTSHREIDEVVMHSCRRESSDGRIEADGGVTVITVMILTDSGKDSNIFGGHVWCG